MEAHLKDVRKRLAKKATFEKAVSELQDALYEDPELVYSNEFISTVQRSYTLLKSRYTTPAFWSAGRSLYKAVQVHAVPSPSQILLFKKSIII